MTRSAVTFENHKGILDHETSRVVFYGLEFKTMVEASRYLKDVPPDDYQVWSLDDHCGLYSPSGFYFFDKSWYNEDAFKELFGIQD